MKQCLNYSWGKSYMGFVFVFFLCFLLQCLDYCEIAYCIQIFMFSRISFDLHVLPSSVVLPLVLHIILLNGESRTDLYTVSADCCWCGGLIGSSTGRDKIHFDLYFLITRSLWEVCFHTQTYSSALLHSPFSLRKFSNQDWDFNLY